MTGVLFVLLIVGVLAVLGWKRFRQSNKVETYHHRPGHTPGTPFEIHRLTDIDERVRRTRCHCGGPLRFGAEGPVLGHPDVRVASCECQLCEEKIRLYFRMDYLN